MKGFALSVSILTCMTAVFLIQEHYSFALGYLLAVIMLAIHFFVVVLYFTKQEA